MTSFFVALQCTAPELNNEKFLTPISILPLASTKILLNAPFGSYYYVKDLILNI